MRHFFISLFFFLFACSSASSQGIYTDFGQNRVQYRQFEWKTVSKENIDILFYGNADMLASITLNTASKILHKLEKNLSYKYSGAMQLVVFNSLSDYRQSNVGYKNPQMNSGGYLRIPNDVGVVYFNGDYNYLSQQLTHEISDLMLREMMYGGTLQDRFDRVRSPMLPTWFTEGVTEFLSVGWSADEENELRDALSVGKLKNFNQLTSQETVLVGHSIWRYLVENYGSESVGTILFIARYTRSAEAAIFFHTKKTMREFLNDWRDFYENNTRPDISQKLPKGKANIPRRISNVRHTAMALSPDGKKVAIVTNDLGRFDIWMFDLQTQRTKHVYHGGIKVLNQLPDYRFPKVRFHPKTGKLTILTFERDRYKLLEYSNAGMKELQSPFDAFSGINDFHFHPDGDKMVFSAVNKLSSDLYEYNFKAKTYIQLTNDMYHDHSAIYGEENDIYFASNRSFRNDTSTSILSGAFNLFRLNTISGKIHSVSHFEGKNYISNLLRYGKSRIGFLCDANGLTNAYLLVADSAMQVHAQTNYMRNILAQEIDAQMEKTAELLLIGGQYTIFTGGVSDNPMGESVAVPNLPWKKTMGNMDSVFNQKNQRLIAGMLQGSDSAQVRVLDSSANNYRYITGFPKVDYPFGAMDFSDSLIPKKTLKRQAFVNALEPEFLLSQSDNRVLGSYLFNNAIYPPALRNPIVMPFIKVSLSDKLRNYIVEAGVRSSLDLQNTDFITRFAILHHRFDHDVSISRHSRKYEDLEGVYMQNISTQFSYSLSYPLSERSRMMLTPGFRREFLITKATEASTLNTPDKDAYFGSAKLEFVYDNSISRGLNEQNGLRFKTGLDAISNVKKGPVVSNLFLDLRWYYPIYKNIQLAIKGTGVYALGDGKVAYYLGAVENWTVKDQFAPNTRYLNGEQYLFQQWVSNLRGFQRGIRVGSSFMLINTEIRVPVLQLIRRKPMESEFFKNLTFTLFGDIGTAFIGKGTNDPSNPFNTITISTPNYVVDVTAQRNPWALGVGYGVRTRVLGYFIKFDRGYGLVEKHWQSPVNYFSLGFDF